MKLARSVSTTVFHPIISSSNSKLLCILNLELENSEHCLKWFYINQMVLTCTDSWRKIQNRTGWRIARQPRQWPQSCHRMSIENNTVKYGVFIGIYEHLEAKFLHMQYTWHRWCIRKECTVNCSTRNARNSCTNSPLHQTIQNGVVLTKPPLHKLFSQPSMFLLPQTSRLPVGIKFETEFQSCLTENGPSQLMH